MSAGSLTYKDIEFVYHVCAYLPLLGILTAFLPAIGRTKGAVVA